MIRLVNYDDSYYIPTLEDFRTKEIKEFEEATVNQYLLNPDIPDLTLSSKSSIVSWKVYDNTTLNFEAWKHSLQWHIDLGRIRVKKENYMGNTTKDIFGLTPKIKNDVKASPLLIKEAIIEAQNILVDSAANADQVEIKAKEILAKKLVDLPKPKTYKGIYAKEEVASHGTYLLKIETNLEETVSKEEVKSFIDTLLEVASKNKLTSIIDILDYMLHPDGGDVRTALEELGEKVQDSITIVDYQFLSPPISSEVISSLSINPIGTSAAAITYICKGDKEAAIDIMDNVMRNILNYKPICVKEDELLPSILEVEKQKEGFTTFISNNVLYNNIALFEKQKRTVGEILKEANIEVLDFIYV